jgi:hypothetical protein
MIDPTRPAIGQRLRTALREHALVVPRVPLAADRVEVSAPGAGVSHAAWLVSDGARSLAWSLVFRVPRRPRSRWGVFAGDATCGSRACRCARVWAREGSSGAGCGEGSEAGNIGSFISTSTG